VQQADEVDAFVSNTDDMLFEDIHGIDPRVILNSTPAHYDDISTASFGLLDSNEAWATLFHENRTSADIPISSHLRGGLL
jgi:hypothetical protein